MTPKEREAILDLRCAFDAGARWQRLELNVGDSSGRASLKAEEVAKNYYPMPKVTRPRVLKIDGGEYRVSNGNLEVRIASASWQRPGWTVEEITALADLIANPTEEVGADS